MNDKVRGMKVKKGMMGLFLVHTDDELEKEYARLSPEARKVYDSLKAESELTKEELATLSGPQRDRLRWKLARTQIHIYRRLDREVKRGPVRRLGGAFMWRLAYLLMAVAEWYFSPPKRRDRFFRELERRHGECCPVCEKPIGDCECD